MSQWSFITNHGSVLLTINLEKQITARKIAEKVGITERSVLRIIKELEEDGYLSIKRVGRENAYTVNPGGKLRRPEMRTVQVGDLMKLLGG